MKDKNILREILLNGFKYKNHWRKILLRKEFKDKILREKSF